MTVQIGAKSVGEDHPCFIIAEAGSNHNQDKQLAKELIDVAAEAGADAVKFQTFSADKLYSKKAPRFTYLKDANVYELIKSIELPREWQQELADYARAKQIMFMSTPFDTEAVDQLDAIGVEAFKMASFELVDLELLAYTAQKQKPVIISTGMATLGDIEDALYAIRKTGNEQIILLHCNSLYPTPEHVVNLRAIETMKRAFQLPVGFSDHTLGTVIPTAAAARGAHVIEKHFTLDRQLAGPDHQFALEPDELKQMIAHIRTVESALGSGVKARAPEEAEMFHKARRSLVAARKIAAGTRITEEMVAVKRPGYGILPKYKKLVVGRVAQMDIDEDDILTWDMV
ncbi:N-acetylneuraminate synthase [Brevibacillus humidisoli]|uniref:N-acetylneuraminate synthase n=1 Tax=Brevibacillus humidisoli TaxID=2895522 RepID=UPI001E5886ED|nr:N-acetylneuraminate synthase [Brevibacillus humidisoli]UFJ43262.1 N-acetylneuraminate synthase [Brevibacillus humidisoli]